MHALATARAVGRELRGLVHCKHIVSVDRHGRNAVAFRLLGEVLHGELLVGSRRIGPVVVFADDDQRQPLHRGEVQSFVKSPGRGTAIADVDEADARLTAQLERQRDPRHHRDHVAQM